MELAGQNLTAGLAYKDCTEAKDLPLHVGRWASDAKGIMDVIVAQNVQYTIYTFMYTCYIIYKHFKASSVLAASAFHVIARRKRMVSDNYMIRKKVIYRSICISINAYKNGQVIFELDYILYIIFVSLYIIW